MGETADHALALAWKAGDRAAADQLFERYYEPVARFFCNKAGEAADDLVQKTFLACLEGIERLQRPEDFRRYLFGVAYRLLCRHYRSLRRTPPQVDFDEVTALDLDPSPSRVVARRREQRLILEGLRRLPLNQQVVLELHYWEGMRGSDIAQVLDIPLGTAKTWLLRGRKALAKALGSIAADHRVLESTLSNLEGWARALREHIGAVEAEPGR
ncbi:MAG: sigma-70 family RNA polymerase sigma factor [Myxococcota bacterium]